jgi:hypothetical protein
MRNQPLFVGMFLLLASSAFCQSYDMKVHLRSGATITIPLDDISRIEFADLQTGVQNPAAPGHAPSVFQLLQNHPNPFNPATTIEYETPARADVALRIFDLHGALVKELLHETQAAGRHHATWDGTDSSGARVSSGVYIYAVECGGHALSQHLILVK